MKIADGMEMLEVSTIIMGNTNVTYPMLMWDEDAVILVDTGYPSQTAKIREAMEKAGVALEKLTTIIITHQDIDHIGGLPSLLIEAEQSIEVFANEVEKPYIEGDKMLLKHTPEAVQKALAALPEEVPEQWRQAFKNALENPPKGRVDRTVADGEELPFCGGIVVLDTPGHSPGHVSLYHKRSKTLIAGDAMLVENGRLLPPDPRYSQDMSLALQSLKKLSLFDIETVICYHGGLYKGDAKLRIAELANG